MFKKIIMLALLLVTSCCLIAADTTNLSYWTGINSQAPQAPKLKNQTIPNVGTAVVAEAVSNGNYQAIEIKLPEPVAIEEINTITFNFGQNIRNKRAGEAAIVLHCDSGKSLVGQFSFSAANWDKAVVNIDAKCFPSLANQTLIGMGKVNRITFSMFAGFNTIGQYLGIANLAFNLKDSSQTVEATGYSKLEYWKPQSGQAHNAPTLRNVEIPNVGVATIATAVSKGGYQGIEIILPEPVDLTNVGAIVFDFGQNVWQGRAGSGSIIIRYDNRNGLMGDFKFAKTEWSKVRVPIDLRTLRSLSKQSNPTLGSVTRIHFSMFASFDEPGEYIGVANLTFEPRQEGSGQIKVDNYRHVATPTSGDKVGNVLIDGEVAEADQPMFRQYADNPDIIFDLGALYLVSRIDLAAVAVPGQNISDYSVYTSKDGKEWKLSAHIKNSDTSTVKKSYVISGNDLTVIGRYVRIKCERSRTDFPLHLAEVSFFGKIPTDEELAAAAVKHYDLGPEMPAVSDENYVTFQNGNISFKLCRSNGVVTDYRVNDFCVAERVFNNYELNDGKNKLVGDSYTNKVENITVDSDSITVRLTNPAIPGVTMTEKWFVDNGILARRMQFDYAASKKYIAYSAIQVVLPQEFRRSGIYETWGAGHDMQHKFAGELVFDFPADSGPVVVFESPEFDTTLLAYRYLYNDEYIHIGSGTVTVSGFGDKRTIFTANGYKIGDGIWEFSKPGDKGSVTSHILVTKGDLTAAFDKYLALEPVHAYRSSIKRPEWINNWRLECGQGWDGYFGKNGQGYAEHYSDLIREGYIIYGACDSDWAWGDFPTEGPVRNLFGGRLTPQELIDRDNAIRNSRSNVKIVQYTWLWSASKTSEIYKNNPDWFITHDQEGRELSFFPGCGINYYRLVGIPESADEIVASITRFINFYNQDLWYLDGGGSPATVDWKNLRLDPPNAWDKVLYRVRTSIQEGNPERAFFCNHPENPVADFGYLESFGGLITTNWRDGATWMYKFKLWQRADKRVNPLYIYWLGGEVDASYRQYSIGTGLGLCFGGSNDKRLDAALISAWPQSRWARLVDANIKPNWRYEPNEMFEIMPLSFGPSGWVFVKSHETANASRDISLDVAPMGLTKSDRPIYQWLFTVRPHSEHKGLLGENEREDNYKASRWASDFLLDMEYLGQTNYQSRISRNISVDPKQLKLWYITQSPALVYGVDNMRNQIWLDNTMGVSVEGAFDNNGTLELTVNSERNCAEIAALIPEGKCVAQVIVNGQAVTWNPAVDANTRMVLINVGKGTSNVTVQYAQAAGQNRARCNLAVTPANPGQTMKLALTPAIDNAVLVISNRGDMVWAKTGSSAEIALPSGITGGEYTATAYDVAGNKLAETTFKLKAGRPRVNKIVSAAHVPQIDASGENWNSTVTKDSGVVTVDPANRTVSLTTARMPQTAWGCVAGGFECDLKRYVKIKLSGNLWFYNTYGLRSGMHGLHVKWDNPAAYLGMVFDFADNSGNYNTRILAGTGHAQERFTRTIPDWGAKKNPDIIASVSNFAVGKAEEEVFWLDLNELGAPSDWQGKTYVSLFWNLFTPDRNIQLQILESTDTLPAGVKCNQIFFVRGGKKAELQRRKLPVTNETITIDGDPADPAWQRALVFDDFYRLNVAGMKAPATSVKMIRDDNNLYVLAELTETKDQFAIDPYGKPWYNDGIEIYIRTRDSDSSYVQYIFALANLSHQEKVSRIAVGAPRQALDPTTFKVKVNGKKAYIEAAIPLSLFGSGAEASRFNIGRNRMVDGSLEAYSIAGGKSYLNFDMFEIIW